MVDQIACIHILVNEWGIDDGLLFYILLSNQTVETVRGLGGSPYSPQINLWAMSEAICI